MQTSSIGSLDIEAYVDGELDLRRRLAVEDHLANNPDLAARVIADIRNATALRLLHQADDEPPAAMLEAARRVSERLSGSGRAPLRLFPAGRSAIAAVLVAGAGAVTLFFATQDAQASSPSYVADAVMAFRIGLLRANMPSQHETQLFDAGDVQRSTHIRVPVLPDGWRISDVQLFPSEEGPALHIMVHTADDRTISVFAVRSAAKAPARPATIRHGEESVSYWRSGEIAYALTGFAAPDELDRVAEDLADNRMH